MEHVLDGMTSSLDAIENWTLIITKPDDLLIGTSNAKFHFTPFTQAPKKRLVVQEIGEKGPWTSDLDAKFLA